MRFHRCSQLPSSQVFSKAHAGSGQPQAGQESSTALQTRPRQLCLGTIERMSLRSQTLSVTAVSDSRRKRSMAFGTADAKEAWIKRRFLESETLSVKKKNHSLSAPERASRQQQQNDAGPSTMTKSCEKVIPTELRRRGRRPLQQTLPPQESVSKLGQLLGRKGVKQNSPLQEDITKHLRGLRGNQEKHTRQCSKDISEKIGTKGIKEKFTRGKESVKCLRRPVRGDSQKVNHRTEGLPKQRGRPRKKTTEQIFPEKTNVLKRLGKRRKTYSGKQDLTGIQTTRSTRRPRKPAANWLQREVENSRNSVKKTGQKWTVATEEGAVRKRGRPKNEKRKQVDLQFRKQAVGKERKRATSVASTGTCRSDVKSSNNTEEKVEQCTSNVGAEESDEEDDLNKSSRLRRKDELRQQVAFEDSTVKPQQHRRLSARGPSQCEYCGRRLCHRDSLLFHIAAHHTNSRPFKCAHCGKAFVTRFKLKCHLNSKHVEGGRRFKCSKCTYVAFDRRTLKVHQLTHSSEKPYKCSECSDAFTRLYYLRTHMRTHTGEKPFECKDCLRSFSQSCSLTRHRRICQGKKPAAPHRKKDRPSSVSVTMPAPRKKGQGNVETVFV